MGQKGLYDEDSGVLNVRVANVSVLAGPQGPKGDKGDDGDAGADGGGITWLGDWSAGSYNEFDAVYHNGTSYIANTFTSDEPPGPDWDTLAAEASPLITSVFGRTGVITSEAGDYTAAEITNTPAGTIAAVTVQAAIDELSSEKLAASSYTAADVLSKLLTVDGAGSGLDADTLDGLSSAAFATASHTQAASTITDFAEAVSDQIGTMVTGNTETNITVTYQDSDNTLDFSVTDVPVATSGVSATATTRSLPDRFRDRPHLFDWIPSANHAGILAASSTYDCASDINRALTDIGAMGGGAVYGSGRMYCGSTITYPTNEAGVSLEGTWGGGEGLSSAPFYLMINHTSGPGVHLRYYSQGLRNLAVVGTGTRASQSHTATNMGILLEGEDTSGGTVNKAVVSGVTSRAHSGSGIVVSGNSSHVHLDRCATRANKGHGYLLTDGTYTGRTNLDRNGQIKISMCRSFDDEGHSLLAGDVYTGSYGVYRLMIDDFEGDAAATNAGLLEGTVSAWIHGENVTITQSAFSGGTDSDRGGVSISGRVHQLINNRYINTVAPVRLVVDPTIGCEDILVETSYVTSGTTAPFLVTAVGGAGAGHKNIRVIQPFKQDFTDLLTTGVPNSYTMSETRIEAEDHFVKFSGLSFGEPTELTISSGAITVTGSLHYVDTQSDAATDDLDTINGGDDGDILILQSAASARDVVVKNGTGNIDCGSDRTLNTSDDKIMFVKRSANWQMISFADN